MGSVTKSLDLFGAHSTQMQETWDLISQLKFYGDAMMVKTKCNLSESEHGFGLRRRLGLG